MNNRLAELLDQHRQLFGMICRDATAIELELIAQAGYHVIWIDLEHSAQSNSEALRLCRIITHLGMVPMVRMIDLSKSNVQQLLDGGAEILAMPDIGNADQARQFVQLGKYPPLGKRGVSSTTPRADYSLGDSPEQTLAAINRATQLLVQFESEEAYEQHDLILSVAGIDMVAVGQVDWGARLGIFGVAANQQLGHKVDQILVAARNAHKLTLMGVSTIEEALHYSGLGVRILCIGLDIALKRKVFGETLTRFRSALSDV